MTHSEHRAYVQMWTKDRNAFDRWMKACAVVGSIFAVVVVIMAVGSSKSRGPEQANAGAAPGTEVSASARHGGQTDALSPHELTIRIAPHELPVQQVNEPF